MKNFQQMGEIALDASLPYTSSVMSPRQPLYIVTNTIHTVPQLDIIISSTYTNFDIGYLCDFLFQY